MSLLSGRSAQTPKTSSAQVPFDVMQLSGPSVGLHLRDRRLEAPDGAVGVFQRVGVHPPEPAAERLHEVPPLLADRLRHDSPRGRQVLWLLEYFMKTLRQQRP